MAGILGKFESPKVLVALRHHIVTILVSQTSDYLQDGSEGEPAKKKFIFLSSSQDDEGSTLYPSSSLSLPSSSKTPLILDTSVSGAVGSVIEVTNHEIIGRLCGWIVGVLFYEH